MEKARTFAGVERERERERERESYNINKYNQAKKLALLSIFRTSAKHENV